MKTGTLYGLSVGPGAPDLITLRAHRVLTRCPVVAWPTCREGGTGYAWRIVREHLDPERQEGLPLVFPMARDWADARPAWERAAARVAGHLRAGRDVAFVTEGDATVYSTFLHLLEAVRRVFPDAPAEIVPGVSSIQAAAALAGRALAQGDERIAILPATWHDGAVREALERFETVVLLKVARVLPRVIDLLVEAGRLEEAVLVSRGTADQQVVTTDLERLRDRRLNYLTLVLVAPREGFLERLAARSGDHEEVA